MENQSTSTNTALAENDRAIRHLRQAIAAGQHWYLALLEAIGLWTKAEETYNGRTYCYLIAGEAFDWLLLAERLCQTVDGLVPPNEQMFLLFHGEPPLQLSPERFKELIGSAKYHQYLNYFYGITVEEASVLAVEEEVQKERWAAGYFRYQDPTNETYRRIYGSTRAILLKHFRRDQGHPHLKSISLTELKEFAYWRFKYRLEHCEKAKVASDTKKALHWLKRQGLTNYLERHDLQPEFIEVLPFTGASEGS